MLDLAYTYPVMYIYFLVLGQIKPEELGKTLTHEHVSMTFEFTYKKPKVIYKGVLTTQGRHGRFLAGKAAIVAATLPVRRHCRHHFLILKN